MNIGPLYNQYLNPRNYSSLHPEEYTYYSPEEPICELPEYYQQLSFTNGFPEDTIPYTTNTQISTIPAVKPLIDDIKQAIVRFNADDPAKGLELSTAVDAWTVADLTRFIGEIKSKWADPKYREAYGPLLFPLRAALLQGRTSLDFDFAGLETGALSYTTVDLFTVEGLPAGSDVFEAISKKYKLDAPAWSTPEGAALKAQLMEAFKALYGEDKWLEKWQSKKVDEWKLSDLLDQYNIIQEKLNNAATSRETRRKLERSFTPAVMAAIEQQLKKTAPFLFQPAWSTPEGAALKAKLIEAYKAFYGDKWQEKWNQRKIDNWTVNALIDNYRYTMGRAQDSTLAEGVRGKIESSFSPLGNQVRLFLLRAAGVNFTPAAASNDPKVKFFLETIMPEVRAADEKALQEIAAQTGGRNLPAHALPGYPTSEIMTPEAVKWFINTWGMLKRQELAAKYQPDLAVVNAFQGLFPKIDEPSVPGRSYVEGPYKQLDFYRSEIAGQLANDPARAAGANLTTEQVSTLYNLVRDTVAGRQWYALVKGLPAEHLRAVEEEAKTRALTAALNDGADTPVKAALQQLRDDVNRLSTELYIAQRRYQSVLEDAKRQNNWDETQLRANLDKLTPESRDRIREILDAPARLQAELTQKKNSLPAAEAAFTASISATWPSYVEQFKIAILWEQTKTYYSYVGGPTFGSTQLQADARLLYSSQGVQSIVDLQRFVNNLGVRNAVPDDETYALNLAYQQIEKKSAEGAVPADYLAPVYGKTYLSTRLPVIYEVRKQAKSDPKAADQYTYQAINIHDPASRSGQFLLGLLQLSTPDGKVNDPAGAFDQVFNGQLDSQTWLGLFPNERIAEQQQSDYVRGQLRLSEVWNKPEEIAKLANNLGVAVDSPEFAFLRDVLTGKARLVAKAKYENGLIAGENNVEFFRMKDGVLTPLTAAENGLFRKLYESYYAGKSVTEQNKVQFFLNSYYRDFGALSPNLESMALDLATGIARSPKGSEIIARLNSDPAYKSLFFQCLIEAVKTLALDTSEKPARLKLAGAIEQIYQLLRGNELNQATVTAAISGQQGTAGSQLNDKLRMLENVKADLLAVTAQLLQSQVISSASSQEDAKWVLDTASLVTERILYYLKSDFAPLNLAAISTAAGDQMNKTSFFVVDTFVADLLARDYVAAGGIEIAAPSQAAVAERAQDWLTDKSAGLDRFQSMHQWLWQEPAAVVLLYFHGNSRVGGNFVPFEHRDGKLVVRNQIVWQDVEKLGNWRISREGDAENGEKLLKAAQVMQRYAIKFGNGLFTEGATPTWREGSGISAADRELVEFAARYLQNWYDKIARITQPVAGAMYEDIALGQMRRESDTAWYSPSQLLEAASQLPAPIMLKKMQMFESDRILALKEALLGGVVAELRRGNNGGQVVSAIDGKPVSYASRRFFEGSSPDAFTWDAELIYRFADNYSALFGHSYFNEFVTGEGGEAGMPSDPAAALKDFARRLKASGKTIQLDISPDDDAETRQIKLMLQAGLMLWRPGMENRTSAVETELTALENFIGINVFGYDDTAPTFALPANLGSLYSLRFKSFLLKAGNQGAGYHFTRGFSLLDENLSPEMIRYAGRLFADFNKILDPQAKQELLKLFKKSEGEMAAMAALMQSYNGGEITGLSFTDNNDSAIEAALVFFVRQIIPNYGMVAEGEADTNFVNMPIILAAQANHWQIGDGDIVFGGAAAMPGTSEPNQPALSFSAPAALDREGNGIGDQLWKGLTKGFQFGLFMHPTIQLGMQAGVIAKLTRAWAAGDSAAAEKAVEELVKLRLSFLAFQYNFVSLYGSAANNFLQGNFAEGSIDLIFGNMALHKSLQLLKMGTDKLIKSLEKKYGRKLITNQWLREKMTKIAGEATVLAENALFEEGKFDPKLKVTVRRLLSSAKDIVFEPLTKLQEATGLSFAEQHMFWKNMIYLAQNPEAIIEIKDARVPVLDAKGKPTGEFRNISFRVRGADLLNLYKQNLSPSLFNKIVGAMKQFTTDPLFKLPVVGRQLSALTNLFANMATSTRPGAWAREHTSRLHGEIVPNLLELNAEALRSGRLSLQDIMQATQIESGKVMEHKFKFSAGSMAKRIIRWATLGALGTNDAGMMMRDISRSTPLQVGYSRLGGTHFLTDLFRSGSLGEPAYKNWQAIYREMLAEGAGDKFSRRQLKQAAAQLYQEYSLKRLDTVKAVVKALAPQHLSAEELAAFNRDGVLTEAQFQRIFNAEKAKFRQALSGIEEALRTEIGGKIRSAVSGGAAAETVTSPRLLTAPAAVIEAEFKALEAATPAVAEQAAPPVTPPSLPIADLAALGIDAGKALDGVDIELQRRFVRAVAEAKAQGKINNIVFEENVRFGHGGEASLEKLATLIEQGNVPAKFQVVVTTVDGVETINIKEGLISRVANGSTVGANGAQFFQEIWDPTLRKLGGNGAVQETPAIAIDRNLTPDQQALVRNIREYLQAKTGVALGGQTPAATAGEIAWLVNNSETAIAEKYQISASRALTLKAEALAAISLPQLENGSVTVDPATGEIRVTVGRESRTFSDPVLARNFVMEQLQSKSLTFKLVNLLNAPSGTPAGIAMGAGSMALTGALAESFVAAIFEGYGAIWQGRAFDFAHVGNSAVNGLTGWGLMGMKMELARVAGLPEAAVMGYAIFLPMLDATRDLSLPVDVRITTGVGGTLGLSGFMLGERMVTGGRAAAWPRQAGGAAFGSLLAAGGSILFDKLIIQSDWYQNNVSYATKAGIADGLAITSDRINSYVYGEWTGALANLATKALWGIETGGWGLISLVAGSGFDLAMTGYHGATGYNSWDAYADQLTLQKMDYWNSLDNPDTAWYRVDKWLIMDTINKVDQAFWGTKMMAAIQSNGFFGTGFGACSMTDGSSCRDYVIKTTGDRYWQNANRFMAAEFLKHAEVRLENGVAKFTFDVAAINRDLNAEANGELRQSLGFNAYFNPQSFWAIGWDSQSYFLKEDQAQAYFQFLIDHNISLPIQDENGTIREVAVRQIVADQQAEMVASEKSSRYLQIQLGQRNGSYQLGSEQHRSDIALGVIDAAGQLTTDPQVVAGADEIKTALTIRSAEKLIAETDLYLGLQIINTLVDAGKLDFDQWAAALPVRLRIPVQAAAGFSARAQVVKAELDTLKPEIAYLEERMAGVPTPDDRQAYAAKLVQLSRYLRELETYYRVAYDQAGVEEMATFRAGIMSDLAAVAPVVASRLRDDDAPNSQEETIARQVLDSRRAAGRTTIELAELAERPVPQLQPQPVDIDLSQFGYHSII